MAEIPTLGRATQGVRIMRMAEGDTVASIGIVLPDEEGEEGDDKAPAAKEAPVKEAPEVAEEAPEEAAEENSEE
jgi:DNA gyrase subunit A